MGASGNEAIDELVGFARETLTKLGDESLSFYGRHEAGKRFDEDLITTAEIHLRELFDHLVAARFPQHRVFDDGPVNDSYTHDSTRYLWIFDPIDGVDNFQAGIPIWGQSLALLDNFWPILGMFYMPATGDLFHALAEGSAYHGNTVISISDETNDIDDESVLLTFSRFHQHYTPRFPGKIRNLGCTAAHVCYVAHGRADAALIANESYRDLAATRVILEAAGGKMFKMDGSGFFLNEYLDGDRIGEHLLVVPPSRYASVRECL